MMPGKYFIRKSLTTIPMSVGQQLALLVAGHLSLGLVSYGVAVEYVNGVESFLALLVAFLHVAPFAVLC